MFRKPYFIWKGQSCKDYFLFISSTDTDIVNDFSIPYKITLNKEDTFTPMYTEEDADTDEFTLSLTLANNEYGIPMKWDEGIYLKVCKWLKSDGFERFISYDNLDYCYYLKVTKIQPRFTYDGEGWVDVTFKPLTNYAYKIVEIDEVVRGTKEIEINNITDKPYEPLFIVHNLGTKNNTIFIDTLGLQGLEEDEVVYVDNYMTNVINSNDENKINCCNREWVTLKPGINKILISGDCDIKIHCEFPMNI